MENICGPVNLIGKLQSKRGALNAYQVPGSWKGECCEIIEHVNKFRGNQFQVLGRSQPSSAGRRVT